MKMMTYMYAVGLGLLTIPSVTVAAGITYDCDTAANHFSELSLPAPGTSFKVTGSVQLNSLAGSTTYVPIARIQVASSAEPGKSPDAYAGFSISALPVDARKMASGASSIQMLSYNLNGKDDEVLPLSIMAKPGSIQPFDMSYDGTKVSVHLGPESKSFSLHAVNPVVRVVCSTGEFLITNLTITPM